MLHALFSPFPPHPASPFPLYPVSPSPPTLPPLLPSKKIHRDETNNVTTIIKDSHMMQLN